MRIPAYLLESTVTVAGTPIATAEGSTPGPTRTVSAAVEEVARMVIDARPSSESRGALVSSSHAILTQYDDAIDLGALVTLADGQTVQVLNRKRAKSAHGPSNAQHWAV